MAEGEEWIDHMGGDQDQHDRSCGHNRGPRRLPERGQ